jgi:hypothetical protein
MAQVRRLEAKETLFGLGYQHAFKPATLSLDLVGTASTVETDMRSASGRAPTRTGVPRGPSGLPPCTGRMRVLAAITDPAAADASSPTSVSPPSRPRSPPRAPPQVPSGPAPSTRPPTSTPYDSA